MTPPRADTLVIVPALNERALIADVLARVRAAEPEVEVLVVDDGSTDGTAAAVRQAGVRVVSHPFNLGYGAALQTGYKWADARGYAFVVQLDADGQHDPRDLGRVLAPVRAGDADLAIGSRFVEPTGYRMSTTRSLGQAVFRRLLVACGGPWISDPTSGFQALSRRAYRLCCADFYPADFPDVDVLLLLHRHGVRIVEVSVAMAANVSSHEPMHGGLRALYYPYKMLLSVLRTALAPAVPPPGPRRTKE